MFIMEDRLIPLHNQYYEIIVLTVFIQDNLALECGRFHWALIETVDNNC